MLQKLELISGRAYWLLGSAVGLMVGVIALAISADVVARNLGWRALPGLHEIVEYALFVSVFLCAPWVLRSAAHIRVDLFSGVLGASGRRRLERIVSSICLLVCVILIAFGWKSLLEAYQMNFAQRKYYVVMDWVLLSVFFFSMLCCAFEFLLLILQQRPRQDERS